MGHLEAAGCLRDITRLAPRTVHVSPAAKQMHATAREAGACFLHPGQIMNVMRHVQAIAPIPNTQSHLLRIVSTLEKDYMKSQPPASLLDLEQYAEGTSSQLLYLQVHRIVSTLPQRHFDACILLWPFPIPLTLQAYKISLLFLITGFRSQGRDLRS
jgi:hypothetical protein